MSHQGHGLALAEPEGIVRPVLDHGAPVMALLGRLADHPQRLPLPLADRSRVTAYARRLLTRASGGGGSDQLATLAAAALAEPLTARERAVLQRVAAGKANKEIAAELLMATGTVKVHLKRIFGKLDVTNRAQAAARARALGLLADG